MIILVPSYKRAGSVITRKWLCHSVLCVHESEAEAYQLLEMGKIAIMPDALKGNMSKVRNWMLDYGFERDNHVIMMDDDVTAVGYHEKGKQVKVDEDGFMEFLERGYGVAEELDVKLWGVNVQSDPMFYMQWAPVSLNVPVLGTLSCHIKHPLRYDERLSLNEDYDMFLQHCLQYRKVLRFDKWHYYAKHMDLAGGCAAYRNLTEEKIQADIMQKKWGKEVVRYNFKKSCNPILRVPF